MKKIYRHGDLLIRECEKKEGVVAKKDNVVAYGKFTGHHHTMVADKPIVYTDSKGVTYIDCSAGSTVITHPEHKEIELSPAFYEVIIEREFDPFEGKINQVKD